MSKSDYKYALIPGRHQALTVFQQSYLRGLLQKDREGTGFSGCESLSDDLQIIWAVTSANHGGTQRNPLSGERRIGMIEKFAAKNDIPSQVYPITNMKPKENFAAYVIEDIRIQSRGSTTLTPQNCVVICSTPSVIAMYEKLGYEIAYAELDQKSMTQRDVLPWDVVTEIIKAGKGWRDSRLVRESIEPTCFEYFETYGLGDEIVEIFSDPLIDSDDGDITDTRDYTTYRQAFEDNAWRKVNDFADFVKPGRILDVGCATGQTLKLLSEHPALFESDFYGVEAARPLFQIAEQRKNSGDFGNQNVYFYQRNIMRNTPFGDNTLDTIITMALTHEIYSYLGKDELERFVRRMYDMLAPGGVYINYDVVGPVSKDDIVHVRFTSSDGKNPDSVENDLDGKAFHDWLESLSTEARFLRFASDFRADEDDRITYHKQVIDDERYYVMRRADLCDFLAKKDYIDSWSSEMHEVFCFFEHDDWRRLLEKVGFTVDTGSRSIQNPWLIENRFAPAAEVFTLRDGALISEPHPVTNTLLVARKDA